MDTTTPENPTSDGHDALLATPVTEVSQQQTTTFLEDGLVDDTGPVTSDYLSYSDLAEDSLANDVIGFLERPIPTTTTEWKSADSVNTTLIYSDTPGEWLSNKMVQEKLSGFAYFRGDFEVRLQVNAQPSNAGALIMYFVPFASATTTFSRDVMLSTGYRHVILDVAQTTGVTLDVPWIHPVAYRQLTQSQEGLGRVYVDVFSPLRGGGNTVEITMYLRAKNIHVALPTSIPLKAPTFDSSGQELFDEEPEISMLKLKMRGRAQMDGEAKVASQHGPVTLALQATSRVAGALGKVPYIGAAASSLSWLANVASGVAGAFGWSRPQDESTQAPMQISYFRTMANFNGDSKAKTLGLDMRNQVRQPEEFFQSKEDEMAISHIVSTPLAVDRFTLAAVSKPGDVLWSQRVAHGRGRDSSSTSFCPSYSDYLSYGFKYWRGGLVFTFKIFKTAMHSGRIRVTFIPSGDGQSPVIPERTYNQVYDIRERSDITFCVPYAYHKAWCDTASSIGVVTVTVVNALRNPTICEPSIDFVVFKHCSPDFQFSFPEFTPPANLDYGGLNLPVDPRMYDAWDGKVLNLPTNPGDIERDEMLRESFLRGKAQMEQKRDPLTMRTCEDLFKVRGMPSYQPNEMTFGEAVTSLRQMFKRYELICNQPITSTADWFTMNPHMLMLWYDQTGDPGKYTIGAGSWLGYISLMYRFQVGSVILGFHQVEPITTRGRVYVTYRSTYSTTSDYPSYRPRYIPEGNVALPSEHPVIVNVAEESGFEVRVPYYDEYPVRLTLANRFKRVPNPGVPSTFGGPSIIVGGIKSCYISKAVGEDFSLGYLLPLPLIRSSYPASSPEGKSEADAPEQYERSANETKPPVIPNSRGPAVDKSHSFRS